MKKMKRISAIILSLVFIFLLASCGETNNTDDQTSKNESNSQVENKTDASDEQNENKSVENSEGDFILGSPQPLTGVNAQAAEATINGIKLAVDEINKDGGLNGQQINLVTYDDQGSPEEAVKIANKMIEIDKVDAVIGPLLSTCQMAQGELINEAEIPTIGIGLSPTFMEQGWDYIVRASLNSNYVMKILAEQMFEFDIESLAIFSGQDDASKSAADAMKAEAENIGIKVTTVETYVDGDTDFSGQAIKMINSKPDAVFCATYANVQPIIAKQLRQFGFEGLCFNKELFQADSLSVAGDAANNWVFAYPYISYSDIADCDIPIMQEFLEKYQEAYGELPSHEGACRGYDAVMILAEGAKNAGSNEGKSIMDGIAKIKDFESLGGTFDYSDGSGEGLDSCSKYIIEDEKYISLDKWIEDGGYEAFKAQ